MDKEKYKNLIETLPKESEELWFEYNLEVNKILQENQKYKKVIDKAIEYIENVKKIDDYLDGCPCYELLNILKGEE